MKYLRKINEGKEEIVEYIEQCFINLLDEGYTFDYDHSSSDYYHAYMLIIEIPDQNRFLITNLAEVSEFISEKSVEIETSIRKVLIKYPDIKFTTQLTLDGEYPDLHIKTEFRL